MEWLKGKKTYIIAGLLILISVITGVADGTWDWASMWPNIQVILGGLGLGALRAGVAKT